MGAYYSVKYPGNKQEDHYMAAACFSSHYREVERIEYFKVYSAYLGDTDKLAACPYAYCYTDAETGLTAKDARQYAAALRAMGFKLKFVPRVKMPTTDQDAAMFIIPSKGVNKPLAVKFLLNCVRYLHESDYPNIVKAFIRYLDDKDTDINLYNKLILALYGSNGGGGHDFQHYYNPLKMLRREEFLEKVLNSDNGGSVNAALPVTKNAFKGQKTIIRNMVNDPKIPLWDVWVKYLSVCDELDGTKTSPIE